MEPVKSSAITHIGYHDGCMYAKYNSGTVYRFKGVTEKMHQVLLSSKSIGKHLLGMGIKGEKFTGKLPKVSR